MTDISIMVLPTNSADEDAPAQIYYLRQGAWRNIPALGRIGMTEIKNGMEEILTYVMSEIEAGHNVGAVSTLRSVFQEQWSRLVPGQLTEHIAACLADCDGPPRFLINSHKMFEWLPWELLYDDVGWLALRCRMARLPIVNRGPDQLNVTQHEVRRVVSFLGARVFPEPYNQEPDYLTWLQLFSEEAGKGVAVSRWPHNGAGWPTIDDFEGSAEDADIIHVTCHGGVDNLPGPYLALDGQGWMSGVTERLASQLHFGTPGPLVFGNACGVVPTSQNQGAAVARGLGVAFYDTGASAYIGAIAKISRPVALRFAREFYRFLLVDHETVGEAVRLTKQGFSESAEPDPSWLFYCLYGSPDMQFTT